MPRKKKYYYANIAIWDSEHKQWNYFRYLKNGKSKLIPRDRVHPVDLATEDDAF
jgi:hypothetical protein